MATVKKDQKRGFFPILYLLFFAIWQYSVNDMATSTNAYRGQGDRTMVYVFLIMILGILGLFCLTNKGVRFIAPTGSMFFITLWVFLSNLLLGNFFNANLWTCLTHFGLTVWWILAIFFGYFFPAEDKRKEKQLLFFVMLMFAYYCYQFVDVYFISNSENEEVVLNLIYRVIVFVPFIYLIENKLLRNSLLLLNVIMTVFSMKRGAIIILPLMMFAHFMQEGKFDRNAVKRLFLIAFMAILAVCAFMIADKATDGFLSSRFSPEELAYGSSRSEKYAAAIDEISVRSTLDWLIGIGSGKRSGVHNEVLEFFYSFGLIGLLLYLLFIVVIIFRYINLHRSRSRYAGHYLMAVIFIIVVGLYSGVYFTHSTFYIMLFIGMIERKIAEEGLLVEKKNRYHHNTRR